MYSMHLCFDSPSSMSPPETVSLAVRMVLRPLGVNVQLTQLSRELKL